MPSGRFLLASQKLPATQPSDFDDVPGAGKLFLSELPSWRIDCISAARPWCSLLSPSELGMCSTLKALPYKPHHHSLLLDMGQRGAEGRVSFALRLGPHTLAPPTDVILRDVGDHWPLDLNSDEVEGLSWKTHALCQKWHTASSTVTPWAANSVSLGLLGQGYLQYWGGIWRLVLVQPVVLLAVSHHVTPEPWNVKVGCRDW